MLPARALPYQARDMKHTVAAAPMVAQCLTPDSQVSPVHLHNARMV
jgi:hypothetical protein